VSGEPLGVALVSREYPPFFGGGIGTYARWIVPALRDAGVRVHVITEAHDDACPRVEVEGPVTVHRVPMSIGRGGWTSGAARFSIRAGRKVTELAARGLIGVAEFAECEGAGAAMLLMRSPRSGVASVVHLHTPSEVLYELRSLSSRALDEPLAAYVQGERLAMRLADVICAPSRFIARWAQAHYALERTPTVIPYALGPVGAAAPYRDSKDVLYVGRVEPRKGVEPLIRAWAGVLRRHPGATLRLAGADTAGAPDGGSLRAYLAALMDEQTRRSVQFLGRLRPEALHAEYARAAVCVVPSLWENYPNTCIEALVHARPVVVSDNGGMAEMIEGTRAGEVFAAGDVASLERALSAVLDEPANVRAQRGEEGRAQIIRVCDPVRVARERIELYRGAIEQRERRMGAVGVRHGGGMLDEWRRCEAVLRADLSTMTMPVLHGAIARWITPVGGDVEHKPSARGVSAAELAR
jgi:glycosyltransferase involved in cell wall biosynthesis